MSDGRLSMLDHFKERIGDEMRDAMVSDMLGAFRQGWAAAAGALRSMASDANNSTDTAGLIHQLANALEGAIAQALPDVAKTTGGTGRE